MLKLLITLGAGLLIGFLLLRLHVPGGMLVGSIIGVVLLNCLTDWAFMFPQSKVVAQSITGAYIGCLITREDARRLPRIIKPFLFVMGDLLLLNLLVAFIFTRITSLDLVTCLFCAVPGGMADTVLIAMDMDANSTAVTVMQFTRLLFGLLCLPSLIILADRGISGKAVRKGEPEEERERGQKKGKAPKASFLAFLPTPCIGLAAGVLGKLSGIPAGSLSLSLIAVAAVNISGFAKPMPIWLRRLAQVLSGCCIGVSVAPGELSQIGTMVLPAAILCAAYLLNCILAGIFIHRVFRYQLRESMLFLSPAGATEMALVAADMGITGTDLPVLQICRLCSVNVFFPQIIRLILFLFGR